MTLLAAILFAIIPHDFAIRESVEMIEVSHCFDYDGREHLTQTIFWGREGVLAWRMNADGRLNPTGKVLYFMDGGIVR